jgi:hypothetical protein
VDVAPGSILLCLGMGSVADTLAAELLVRALREQGLDGRHVAMGDLAAGTRPPDASPGAAAIAYLVSAFPSAEREQADQTTDQLRQHLSNVRVVSVFLPGMSIERPLSPHAGNADYAVSSFVEAVRTCPERQSPETAHPVYAPGP